LPRPLRASAPPDRLEVLLAQLVQAPIVAREQLRRPLRLDGESFYD
jgi:hypothetical protein